MGYSVLFVLYLLTDFLWMYPT